MGDANVSVDAVSFTFNGASGVGSTGNAVGDYAARGFDWIRNKSVGQIRPAPVAASSGELLFAHPSSLHRSWLPRSDERLVEIANLASGWDSYGAPGISIVAINTAHLLIQHLAEFTISEPVISPTVNGGLNISWSSPVSEILLDLDGRGVLTIFYSEVASNYEWEGSADLCSDSLHKWLWTSALSA
jgi:hypothetical protein